MRTLEQQKQWKKVRKEVAELIFLYHFQSDDWQTFYLASQGIQTLCYSKADQILSLASIGVVDDDQSAKALDKHNEVYFVTIPDGFKKLIPKE